MPNNLLLDTGFWFALYETSDEHHEKAMELAEYFDFCTLLIPWPSLYETLNTRFVRRSEWLRTFEPFLYRPGTVILPDETYRAEALAYVMRLNRGRRAMSLVDIIIRSILEDPNTKVDAMMTFNQGDFLDICLMRNIEIISDSWEYGRSRSSSVGMTGSAG